MHDLGHFFVNVVIGWSRHDRVIAIMDDISSSLPVALVDTVYFMLLSTFCVLASIGRNVSRQHFRNRTTSGSFEACMFALQAKSRIPLWHSFMNDRSCNTYTLTNSVAKLIKDVT